jgi:hypothetical protein
MRSISSAHRDAGASEASGTDDVRLPVLLGRPDSRSPPAAASVPRPLISFAVGHTGKSASPFPTRHLRPSLPISESRPMASLGEKGVDEFRGCTRATSDEATLFTGPKEKPFGGLRRGLASPQRGYDIRVDGGSHRPRISRSSRAISLTGAGNLSARTPRYFANGLSFRFAGRMMVCSVSRRGRSPWWSGSDRWFRKRNTRSSIAKIAKRFRAAGALWARLRVIQVTVTVPDELVAALVPAGRDPGRAAVEAMALEAYRERRITAYRLRMMLDIPSRFVIESSWHRAANYPGPSGLSRWELAAPDAAAVN